MRPRDHLGNKLMNQIQDAYQWANDRSGGALGVVKDAFQCFGDARAGGAAASMAYYAMFSLFPLLLLMVAAGSFVLEREQANQLVVGFFNNAFPVAQRLIERNIQSVLERRGAVGVVGLLSLMWSASGVFTTLARNINLAWPEAEAHNFVKRRLLALAIVGMLAILLLLSLLSNTVLSLLPRLNAIVGGDVSAYQTFLWAVLSNVAPWLFPFLLFWGLYRWVPNTRVRWSHALWGATVATVAWQVITDTFSWYLSSGLAKYNLVYGSLGAVVALMFWIYLSSWITLFGAHLTAAISRRQAQGVSFSDTGMSVHTGVRNSFR